MQTNLGRHGKKHRRQHGDGGDVGQHADADKMGTEHEDEQDHPPRLADDITVHEVRQVARQSGLGHRPGHGERTTQEQEGPPHGAVLHFLPGKREQPRDEEHDHTDQTDDAKLEGVQLIDRAAFAHGEQQGDTGKYDQQRPFTPGHLTQILMHFCDLGMTARDNHVLGLEMIPHPPLGQDKHAEVRELQQHPVEVADVEPRLAENTDHDQVGEMRGHDKHAADHGSIDEGLYHNGLFRLLFLRGVAQQVGDALNHRQQGCGACVGGGDEEGE